MKKKKMSSGEEQVSLVYFWWIWLRIFVRKNIFERFRKFRERRPHRSFRLTRRRDYVRPLKIAGYWSFTKGVFRLIFSHKKTFFSLIALIAFSNFLLVGLLDQDFLESLQEVASLTGGEFVQGFWGEISKAGLIVLSTFSTGGLVKMPNEYQQIVILFVVMFSWLTVVQLCRNIFAGNKRISLREALYSCGAPIIPTIAVVLVMLVQAVPMFVGIIISSAASLTSFASQGVEQMIFTAAVLLLFSLSAYWMVGSFFALIIVTIPGTFPSQALRISGDMVSQRRLAILFRIIWCALIGVFLWMIIVMPIILATSWLNSTFEFTRTIPIVQISMLLMSSFSLVFSACYIYTLYRKIVDHDRKI